MLRSIYKCLCRIWHKWKYGIIYLLFIPIFAAFYMLVSDDFYQSTVVQEGIVEKHNRSIESWLIETLQKKKSADRAVLPLNSCTSNNHPPLVRQIADATPILKYGAGGRIDEVWASLTVWTSCDGKSWHQRLFNLNTDIFYGDDKIKLHFTEFLPEFLFSNESQPGLVFDKIRTNPSLCDEIKTHFQGVSFYDEMCSLTLDEKETAEFKALREQYNKSLSGQISGYNQFARMLYLSTVTITTLGYGDIVPITRTSRILVSAEAILGMIFIGLFLNSIINQRKAQTGE